MIEAALAFTPLQIAVALLAALVSAFVRGLAGFGLAILLVPVLALALDPIEAVLVANFLGLVMGLGEWRWLWSESERSARTLSLLVVATTLPGMAVLALTPPPLARLLIALVALASFAAVLLPKRATAEHGRAVTFGVGVSSGLLTGFAGMPGPPVVPYYIGRPLARETAKASMMLIFTVAGAIGLVSGAALGRLDGRLLLLGALLWPVVLLGNALGRAASGRIGDSAWRVFAAGVLGAAALAALLKL